MNPRKLNDDTEKQLPLLVVFAILVQIKNPINWFVRF